MPAALELARLREAEGDHASARELHERINCLLVVAESRFALKLDLRDQGR